MDVAACAVGRIGQDGPWVGFAPTIEDGYALVVGGAGLPGRRMAADADDLLALACLYFEEALDPAPDELAATLGDIGSVVRHVAEHETDLDRRRVLGEAVDAVDDGLAADVTIARLRRALGDGVDAAARIRDRVELLMEMR
jgi:hypothetical protein